MRRRPGNVRAVAVKYVATTSVESDPVSCQDCGGGVRGFSDFKSSPVYGPEELWTLVDRGGPLFLAVIVAYSCVRSCSVGLVLLGVPADN